MSTGPIYENRVFVDPELLDDYEAWFREQARRARELPGVVDTSLFTIADDDQGRPGRACQFVIEDDEALAAFIDNLATEIEAKALDRFGDRIDWRERILREDRSSELPAGEMPECLNCGAHLRGQYCAHCGQRARSRLISLWELVREAFGDLFEFDSRLWRTVVPLLIRPGLLTRDYLQGRRARYMPPFRTYLVLSLLFFLVAFFNPRETFGIFYDPQSLAEAGKERGTETEALEPIGEPAAEGIIVGSDNPPARAADARDGGTARARCKIDDFSVGGPEWLERRLTPERLAHVCEQLNEDDGREFLARLIDNIPVALIVLLPIMAFVLKALYPLSRRYYVEHLLFFVHFHAFFFLILILQILIARTSTFLQLPEAIGALVFVTATLYVPVYLFVAMRRVYGQSRLLTSLKYVVLTTAYVAGFTLTMLAAVTMAALSI